jgi:hypothetical protein
MPIVPSDLKFFQSELEGSSGGPISLTEIPQGQLNLIFKDTTQADLVDGSLAYKKVFVINTSPSFSLAGAVVYTLLQPTSGERLALALGTPTDTDPTTLEFQEYNAKNAALLLGDLATNESKSIWMRRLTPAGLENFDENAPAFFQLAISEVSPFTALLSFGWELEPKEEEEMSSQISYTLKVQGTDANSLVTTQAEVDAVLPLDMEVAGDNTYKVPAGAIDMPLNILDSNIDVVILIPKTELTVKFQSTAGTPFPLRAKGANLLDTKDIVAVFVSNPGADSNIRFIQGSRSGA